MKNKRIETNSLSEEIAIVYEILNCRFLWAKSHGCKTDFKGLFTVFALYARLLLHFLRGTEALDVVKLPNRQAESCGVIGTLMHRL